LFQAGGVLLGVCGRGKRRHTQVVTLGLSAGFSPGPLLALVVSQTLQYGTMEGIKVAIAPLLTDCPIILVSLFVLARVANSPAVLGAKRNALTVGTENGRGGRAHPPRVHSQRITPKRGDGTEACKFLRHHAGRG